MSVIRLIRPLTLRTIQPSSTFRLCFSNKSDKDGKDDKSDEKKEKSTKKLKELLTQMTSETNFNLVKSVIAPKRRASSTKKDDAKPTDIFEATKQVAEELGGNTKKTESELLSKLLNYTNEVASDNTLKKAGGSMDLSEIIANMKVDSTLPTSSSSKTSTNLRSKDERTISEKRSRTWKRDMGGEKKIDHQVDFFGGKPLGIFNNADELKDLPSSLRLWNEMEKQELKTATSRRAKNHFEKMAQWTEEGKLWKFPIDNEQGMDEEAKVSFTEHIFLDKHLASWCPAKGPIRHFMELVCVGLSKNPYYTVAQKTEHIEWYKNYFETKKDILASVIVDKTTEGDKQIEK